MAEPNLPPITAPLKRCSRCKQHKPRSEFAKASRAKDGLRYLCKPCDCAGRAAYYVATAEARREAKRAWRAANPEKSRAQVKAYKAAHPDEVRARMAAWNLRNQDYRQEYNAAYRKKHGEELRKAMKEWNKANRAHRTAYNSAYHKKNKAQLRQAHREWCKANSTRRTAYNVTYRKNNLAKLKEHNAQWRAATPERLRHHSSLRRARERSAAVGDKKLIADFYAVVSTAARLSCYWCGKNVPKSRRHVDHIIALARGGKHAVENLCCSCAKCNLKKRAKTPEEFTGQMLLL